MSFGARWADEGERAPLPGGHLGLSVADPGTRLSAAEQEEIFVALVIITSASFGANMTEHWRARREDNYFSVLREFSVVPDPERQIVGWTGFQQYDTGRGYNFYIDSTDVVPGVQSGGLIRALFRARITDRATELTEGGPAFLSARSESPIFYQLMERIVGRAMSTRTRGPTSPRMSSPAPGASPTALASSTSSSLRRTSSATPTATSRSSTASCPSRAMPSSTGSSASSSTRSTVSSS